MTAKHADRANFVHCSVEEYRGRLEALRKRCEEVGRSFDDIEKTWHGFMTIGDERKVKELSSKFVEGTTIYEIREAGLESFLEKIVAGTADECIRKLEEYVDLGVSYFVPHFLFSPDLEDAETFMKEIAPSFR